VRKVYRVKRRAREKMLSIIVGSHTIAKNHIAMDNRTLRLVRKFMPGPLTLVSPARSGKHTIAWRIPGHWLALELAKRFGKPIVATSANISGGLPLYKFEDVKRVFDGKADIIINSGNLPKRTPSTIFDVQKMKILRKGPVSKKSILAAFKRGR
jgi:L-threonylcarbamoyladenylate synthase